jgi:Protein of unknown function (DUF4080)
LQSFARGFDRLLRLRPHEIQVGILKRLRGTPIARHTKNFDMRYNPDPPYDVLATDRIDFSTVQRLTRFARYWEMVGNSGRFRATLALLLGSAPFERFMHFSDWLFETTRKTHAIALERLFDLLYVFLSEQAPVDRAQVIEALLSDYAATGAKGKLAFMTRGTSIASTPKKVRTPGRAAVRQARHARP